MGKQSSELGVQVGQRGFFGFRIISSAPGQLNRAGVQLPTALRVRVRLRDHWHLHGTTARWQHWALVNSGLKVATQARQVRRRSPAEPGSRWSKCRLPTRSAGDPPTQEASINLRLPACLRFLLSPMMTFSRTGRKHVSFPALSHVVLGRFTPHWQWQTPAPWWRGACHGEQLVG